MQYKFELNIKYIAILFSLFIYSNLLGQDSWIVDKNGCKVFNPYPKKGESIEWTGSCIDSFASGYGKLTWFQYGLRTKNVFTGNIIKGKIEGIGKYELFRGEQWEGEFKNGYFYKGVKKERIAGRWYIFKGIFSENELTGIGELKVEGEYSYYGNFLNGYPSGKGEMYFHSGDYFEGTFKESYFVEGIYTSKRYGYIIESSDWKYYSPNSGTMTYDDGIIYIGDLKNDSPHGFGTLIYPDNKKITGKWEKGKLVKEKTIPNRIANRDEL